MPTVVTPDGVRRGMGYVLIGTPRGRRRGLRGLGADCPEGSVVYAPTGQCTQIPSYRLQKDLNDYLVAAQEGQYGNISPDQLQAMLTQEVANMCKETFIPCTGSELAQAGQVAAQYAANPQLGAAAPAPAPAAAPSSNGLPIPQECLNVQAIPTLYAQCLARNIGSLIPASPPPSSSTPTGLPLGVTLQNATGTSNTQFRVGDSFRLVVTGPANSQVTGSSQHDGKGGGSVPFGTTDANGRAVITGTMTPDTVGGWVEQWYVGGQNAGSVSFSVVAPAAATARPPDTSKSSAGSSSSTTPPPAGSTPGFDLSFLTQNAATVGGTSIPWWALLAVGGVALYAFTGSHGKR